MVAKKERCCYFSDFVDPLICDGPCIEFVGIIAWSINQIPSLVFGSETQPTGKYELAISSTHYKRKQRNKKPEEEEAHENVRTFFFALFNSISSLKGSQPGT